MKHVVWREFDLSARIAKLERAFARAEVIAPEDVPVLVNTPCYFAFGTRDKPADYFTNPASMVAYQAEGYYKHLRLVHDDYVPYFMPRFGTGVLASAFGCEIGMPSRIDDDPAVIAPCIRTPADAAKLKLPDPARDGWMPRVLAAIDYAREHCDLPVGLTDMQGPLDTLGLMCGQVQLFQWMYDEPDMVRELFELVTEAFIQWVKVQKQHIGEPLDSSNGLQGVASPGIGVWESADDMVMVGARFYQQYVEPCAARIAGAFGGGSVHFCGKGLHHVESLRRMPGVRVVNNSPLGNFAGFAELKRRLGDRITLEIQDSAPLDVEGYYTALFDAIDDFRGIILAPFVVDCLAMDNQGGYMPIEWDTFETANRIVDITRKSVERKLNGH
jgi:uroporphyrinogen-III decarboxylase